MKKMMMTNAGLKYPRLVLMVTLLITAVFVMQFPKVKFDNDPENMLSEDEAVRIFHNRIKEKYDLYDFVIVGVVNTNDPDGIFNVETLGRIDVLTKALISLHQNDAGRPAVMMPSEEGGEVGVFVPDLLPQHAWKRSLQFFFRHDVYNLFDEDGAGAIITPEIISPSVVDNIRQADYGQLAVEYLMETPPTNRQEALAIKRDAMNNPLYKGTMVSEDGKAIALYVPIREKTYSYNVANLIEALTADWPEDDRVFITGQPVAQDTFGVEMLVQMATSAPLAALAIFILLYLFFRRFSLIIAPMLLAVVSVLVTMGLLISLGFDVHIMSSMIAIFLMPIAVADSVHILSEFFDTYHRFRDKAATVRYVIGHLFTPMLYTTLTTMAGFASLGLTPIPPVRIFGLHIAFGVGLAWILTMIFIPAYIMLFVTEKSLHKLCAVPGDKEACEVKSGRLDRLLEWLGQFSYVRWKWILSGALILLALALIGISRIEVNDNPIKWFAKTHRIREADRVLNQHFGGTYTAYLTFEAERIEQYNCNEKAEQMEIAARERFADDMPEALDEFLAALGQLKDMYQHVGSADLRKCLYSLVESSRAIDEAYSTGWPVLSDVVLYLDPEGLTAKRLKAAASEALPDESTALKTFVRAVDEQFKEKRGAALQEAALHLTDTYNQLSFADFVYEMEAELTAPLFKKPEHLAYIEKLQTYLKSHPVVGKTSSAVDALKKANYELNYVAGRGADNSEHYRIPKTVSGTAQVFTQLEGMKKKDSLFHLVTKDYQEANIWVQLKSGDNKHMEDVVEAVDRFISENPPPVSLRYGWAGLTYINVVWQEKMVVGMLSSLGSSFIVVMLMMMVLFRSPLFGLLSMLPLSVTIALIYGIIGLVGKDYDMPVAVLSALTLGLSVDFAIHFLQRARELQAELGSWQRAIKQMFKEPAMAISRNAIIISIGFTPLLAAPLVPYKTVGFFLATIMLVSWLATLFILAALMTALQRRLFNAKLGAKTGNVEGR